MSMLLVKGLNENAKSIDAGQSAHADLGQNFSHLFKMISHLCFQVSSVLGRMC